MRNRAGGEQLGTPRNMRIRGSEDDGVRLGRQKGTEEIGDSAGSWGKSLGNLRMIELIEFMEKNKSWLMRSRVHRLLKSAQAKNGPGAQGFRARIRSLGLWARG